MNNEKEHRPSELRMIPLDRIEVLNPRERNSRVFEQIVGNIQSIGSDCEHYLLICGEGRFKSFKTISHLLASTPPKITVQWGERADGAPGAPVRVYRLAAA